MILQILKTAIAGILAGIALFMIPFFLVKVFVIFMLLAASMRLLGFSRRRRFHHAYAHQYRNMNDEERAKFREDFFKNYGHGCGYGNNMGQATSDK